MTSSTKLSTDFIELLKLETSIVSLLYVVLGFSITAITGQNNLLVSLSDDGSPDYFVPYWPLFSNIVAFTLANIFWMAAGLYVALHDRISTSRRSFVVYVAYTNGAAFTASLGYFAYTAWDLVGYFKFPA